MPERVLEVSGLRCVFPGRRGEPDRIAVADLSFTLDAGLSVGIVGDSGSGKTTTLRMIAGLERPSSGQIVVCGRARTPGRSRASERRRRAKETQLVFQDPYASLDPRRRVEDEIGAVLDLHLKPPAAERKRRIEALLDQVGLSQRHARLVPRSLSGGERQRVAIARALAAEPRVLLLDEPVASLDVSIQAQILNLLLEIQESTEIAYVFVAHDLGIVRQVCEEVIVMRDGKVVERGPTRLIFAKPQDPYTQRLLQSVPRPGWKPGRSRENGAGPTQAQAFAKKETT